MEELIANDVEILQIAFCRHTKSLIKLYKLNSIRVPREGCSCLLCVHN